MAVQLLDPVAQQRHPDLVDDFVDLDTLLEAILEAPEFEDVLDGIQTAIAKRRSKTTDDKYRYWVKRFLAWLGDPTTRWRGKDAPALAEPSSIFPLDERGFGLATVWIQDLVSGPPAGHPARADFDDDGPISPGTLNVIGSALRAGSLTAGGDWEPPQRFIEFMRGQRRILGEKHTTVRAMPLLRDDVDQICRRLASVTCPRQRRDWVVTELAANGLTPSQIDRAVLGYDEHASWVDTDEVREMFDLGEPIDAAIRAHVDLIGPRIELTAANRRRDVAKILSRVADAAGVSIGRWDHTVRPEDAVRMRDVVTSGVWSPAQRRAVHDRALLLIGWLAMLRRSEIAALRPDDVPCTSAGVSVEVRRSKTDQYAQGSTVHIAGQRTLAEHIDPRRALEDWLELRARAGLDERSPLFCAIDRHGNLTGRQLSGDAIQKIIQRNVLDAGLATVDEARRYRGHSLRRGAITTAAIEGADVATIQAMSRHKDAGTVITYVESAKMRQISVAERLGL